MTRERKLVLGWHFIFALIFTYGLMFATHFTFHFEPLKFMDQYQLQANGFSNHKLSVTNRDGSSPYTFDCAIYKNTAYNVYGPIPAIFQLSLNNILNLKISSSAIVFSLTMTCLYIFFWLCHFFFVEILMLREEPATILAGAICLALSLTDRFLQNAVVGFAWTEASVTSQIFLLLSIGSFLKYHQSKKEKFLFLAGVFSALTGLGKQNYLFNFIPTVCFIVYFYPQLRCRRLFIYLSPVLIGLTLLLFWNNTRFENPFEFGLKYVNTTDLNPNNSALPQLHRIPFNLYNHFLAPVRFDPRDFPLLTGKTRDFGKLNLITGGGGLLHNFQMISMFVSSPLLISLPLYAFWLLISLLKRRKLEEASQWWLYLMGVNVSVFSYFLVTDSSWSRYQFDIWFISYLCATIALVHWFRALHRPFYRDFRLSSYLIVTISILFSAFVGLDQTIGILVSKNNPFVYTSAFERSTDRRIKERTCLFRTSLFHLEESCL